MVVSQVLKRVEQMPIKKGFCFVINYKYSIGNLKKRKVQTCGSQQAKGLGFRFGNYKALRLYTSE